MIIEIRLAINVSDEAASELFSLLLGDVLEDRLPGVKRVDVKRGRHTQVTMCPAQHYWLVRERIDEILFDR